ncbi:MAG: type IV pili methyl-accepting chemotaxis transducer N-terminal domain-containing protein [Deltaproteobacteria bacterium]|nr:type IV pili methyl-accepting chemotaxis transducer N-terminal domain-containing protein [Deltaproteobacteria bacterium]
MSEKYSQVVEASALRKRAVELNYVLNRHIMNGEEELEKVFQDKKAEYGKVIENLRNGTPDLPAIKDTGALAKLDIVSQKWAGMLAAMDRAMESGDSLSIIMRDIEDTTYPMVDKMNGLVKGFVALNDPGYSKSIDLAGLQRMRTVNMAYLMERYARSNYDLENVSANLNKTINDFEGTIKGLRYGSSELGLRPVHNTELLHKFTDAEELWSKRKGLVFTGIKDKDLFYKNVMDLANNHTPEIVNAADDLTKVIAANARKSAMKGILVMAAAVFVSAALSIFFMWSTNTHIIKPIFRIKETVEGFSQGDLSRRSEIKIKFLGKELKDEVTSLGDSVDTMVEQMSGVIGRITDSSNLLASAAEQLSASSTQIEEGANRQSGQTAQAATSMEQMNATVIEVAKNSSQVSESARSAQQIASKGGEVVSEAILAMQEVAASTSVTADTIKRLGRSSEEIGTIVSVINDIADQTNLLALNAAIEAARAGEQGRGFAVVADEVRKLAERTTKATKEISSMINTIQAETGTAVSAMDEGTSKVENGVRLANEAGDALKKIVTGVENVTDMISHIATSAEEQSATTDEITQNMDSIAEVAKGNVSAVAEVAKATNEMARLATELKGLVSNFKISRTGEFGEIKVVEGGKKRTAHVRSLPYTKRASGDLS